MKKIFLNLFILFFLFSSNLTASDSVKITIVERITHFIQWPNLKDDFTIGIYQDENLKNLMIKIYEDKKIHKLPIKVFNIKNKNDKRLKNIDLLYLTKESSKNVDSIIQKIKNKPVLIVTEHPNDVYQGMHLGLYYKNKRIKFVINQESLENSNLKASYKILKLAKIVKVEEK